MDKRMQLSVCIITKNEQENIARCLESLRPYDLELVVVDTGSVDDTKKIAAGYTEKLYDFEWCDDFAAARNYAISKASNTAVLVLDSDEYIKFFDKEALEKLLKEHPEKVGRIRCQSTFERKGVQKENHEWVNRIFDKNKFQYEGRIHEQIVSREGTEYDTYQVPLVIGHTGYDLPEAALKKKAQRNMKLLQQELQRLLKEDGVSTVAEDIEKYGSIRTDKSQLPYILYQLGKSCYMLGDYVRACEYFSEGLSYDLNPKLEYVIDMVETYGYALLNSGRAEEALFFENIYNEFGEEADFKFLMGLIYMNNERYEDAVKEFLKATECKESRMVGVNSYMAYYNIAVIYECLDRRKEARAYYQRCGEYEPARERLRLMS